MDKAKDFAEYFQDEKLAADKRERLDLVRRLVHEIYPEVQERVSYAMPGFYPKGATKTNQQLFLLMANKNWLGIYGTPGLAAQGLADFANLGFGKGSIQVPYDYPETELRRLIKLIISYNLKRYENK